MRGRPLLLLLAFLLGGTAVLLVVTGGFVTSIGGARVSMRSPWTAAFAALLVLAGWALLAQRAQSSERDVTAIETALRTHWRKIVITIAAAAAAIAIRYGAFAAAGSDASGYLSQAAMLADGALSRVDPLAAIAVWPGGEATLSPLGWRPGRSPGEQVPTYPIGLPLLLMPLHALGGALAASWVSVASLLVAVVATGFIAHRLGGPLAAVVAATGIATSPIALVQGMQVMSDLPVTAAWLTAWALLSREHHGGAGARLLRTSALAGGAAALAIMIRPNLAPAAIVPALFAWLGQHEIARSIRRRRALLFAGVAAAGPAAVAWFHWQMYGSAFRSGYGTVDELYSLQFVAGNVLRYPRWLVETHGPWMAGGLLATVWPRTSRPLARWLIGFAGLNYAAYLPFAQFDTWDYLRFVLPAVAIVWATAATVFTALVARVRPTRRLAALGIMSLVIIGFGVETAQSHGVFEIGGLHARYRSAGHFLAARIPIDGVVLAGEHSGSARYYTGRSTLRWDVMPDHAIGAALERLMAGRHDVWIVLDEWEEERFRGAMRERTLLDWPPALETGRAVRTRAWRLADRARFMAGDRVVTDVVP